MGDKNSGRVEKKDKKKKLNTKNVFMIIIIYPTNNQVFVIY